MNNFMKTSFLLLITLSAALSASIRGYDVPVQDFNLLGPSNSSSFPKIENNKELVTPIEDLHINPSRFSISDPQDSFALGKVVAEFVKRAMDIISKLDLSEHGLRALVQLMVPLITLYWGPSSEVLIPLLSGIASVLFKSLAP